MGLDPVAGTVVEEGADVATGVALADVMSSLSEQDSVGVGVTTVVLVVSKGGHERCAGLHPPGIVEEVGVVEGAVVERTMVAVAEAHHSLPLALSSPTQACRSQAHATSGTPDATQDL